MKYLPIIICLMLPVILGALVLTSPVILLGFIVHSTYQFILGVKGVKPLETEESEATFFGFIKNAMKDAKSSHNSVAATDPEEKKTID